MIKLNAVKPLRKKRCRDYTSVPMTPKRAVSGYLRVIKDVNELDLPEETCSAYFPDPDDLRNFKLRINPKEGYYKGQRIVFAFNMGPNFPYDPPNVLCESRTSHPNMGGKGGKEICLHNLSRWNSSWTINYIVEDLLDLFLVKSDDEPHYAYT